MTKYSDPLFIEYYALFSDVTKKVDMTGLCGGRQHTSSCCIRGILLCLLIHIHIHLCHGTDLETTAVPSEPANYSNPMVNSSTVGKALPTENGTCFY